MTQFVKTILVDNVCLQQEPIRAGSQYDIRTMQCKDVIVETQDRLDFYLA